MEEMKRSSKKVRIFKILVLIAVIAILIVATIQLWPMMKNLTTEQGRNNFKETVQGTGIVGFMMLMGLELAQIFLAFLPGEPLEILAGMCYGAVGGTLFILFSVFISTTILYFIVRKFGKNFIYEFISKEKIDKIENSKIFNNPKKIEKILIILFFIPGTPKDFLVYLGGILPVKPLRFILISTFARFPSIISSTLVGANIMQGSWKAGIALYGTVLIFVIITILIFRYIDKDDNDTKEALKSIK